MLIQPLTPEIIEKRRRFGRKFLGVPGRMWRSPFSRRARRGLLWTLAIGFVLHSALNIYASVELNRELAAIRQKREPLQFSELAPPAVPDAQNAARVYAQATKALRFSREEKAVFNTRESQRTPEQQKIIAAALAKNQKALDLARRAAAMPKCVFPLDYGTKNPIALLFPYYAEMRELARLLSAQAQIEAKRGDVSAALRDVRAVFGMAHHLSDEPVLIGFLVAQAVDAIANQGLARVLESAPISLAQSAAFEGSLPPTNWNRAFKRCLMGERSWEIFAFDLMRGNARSLAEINAMSGGGDVTGGDEGPPVWILYPLFWLWNPVSKLDEVQNLRLWRKQLDAAANPRLAFSKSNQNFDKAIEKLPRYAILTRILMPVFSRVGDNRDRAEVRRRQREIALKIAWRRTAEGYLAENLEEVGGVNDDPALFDPYSNKPMVYRLDKNEKGFTLYSIGPNRKDDGGKDQGSPYWPEKEQPSDDIVWGGSKRNATQ